MCEVGRKLLCVLFLHARSNDFFLIHFIYLFCKMALIVYIPQSPCRSDFLLVHALYVFELLHACLGELGTVQAQNQVICTWGLIL